jgi:hypothetical protein
MSKITGNLHLTSTDWRFVYNTILNYFNQEINLAYNEAIDFWTKHNTLDSQNLLKTLNDLFEQKEITQYRKDLIKFSLVKAGSTKIYKPKKTSFEKYTNRTTYIHTSDVNIDFDKQNKIIDIQTSNYDDFDKFMANNTFITEFINMINTINWPTRTGPNKTTRGCTLIRVDPFGKQIVFYTSGPNPPVVDSKIPSEVLDPPIHITASAIKNIKLTSENPQDTYQPLPVSPTSFEDI